MIIPSSELDHLARNSSIVDLMRNVIRYAGVDACVYTLSEFLVRVYSAAVSSEARATP